MANGDFKFTVNEGEYRAILAKVQMLAKIGDTATIKKAFRTGGRILISSGRSSLNSKNKKKTGNLYRSFTSNIKKKNTGILVGFKRGKGLGNHAHLIDRGTDERWAYTRNGKPLKKPAYRGKIDEAGAGRNGYQKTGKTFFWTNVVETRGQEAMDRIVDAIYQAIDDIKNRN